MNTKIKSKINHLVSNWPRGTVFPQLDLSRSGYYHDLVKSYRKSQWIEQVGVGAFKLVNDQIDWFGGLYALQCQLNLPIHVGGKTALELKGYAHYGRLVENVCFLFGAEGSRLPNWFRNYNWRVQIIYKATGFLPMTVAKSFSEYQHKEFSIRISAPERAALEMLYYVPDKQGFDEALKIMETLVSLRPELMQELLERCQFVKVKRLFMYMAERLALPWFRELKTDLIDLGQGKRVIVTNGVLDKKYLITVAKEQLT